MKVINYACCKLEKKPLEMLKRKKKSFINVTGDKLAMRIRRGKLTISFCKKHFQLYNYLQLL